MSVFIPPNPHSVGLKILLVDDSLIVHATIGNDLKELKHSVVAIADPIKAIQVFKNEFEQEGDSFDLLLTDYKMPGMNGLTLIKKVKEIDKDINILMFTIEGNRHSLKKAVLDEGAEFIDKRADKGILYYTIAGLLEKKKK